MGRYTEVDKREQPQTYKEEFQDLRKLGVHFDHQFLRKK